MPNIVTIPATTTGSSVPYFNPKTQRFHDPETKRMVKTSSALGTKALDKGTGSSLGGIEIVKPIFTSMMRSLIGIEAILMKMWGIAEAEKRAEGVDARFAAGETDAPPDDGDDKKGPGFFGKLKGMFGKGLGKIKAMPNWLKTLGLGALLFWLSKNRDAFAKMIVPLLEWIKATVDYLSKSDWSTLKNDFKEKIIQPSLAALGLEMNEQGGIDRIKGSWLDVLDPFTGPTNIFNTIKHLWKGINPDTGESFLPEWMTTPIGEFSWIKKTTEFLSNFTIKNIAATLADLWKGEYNGEKFLPEWMYTPINETEWYKKTKEFVGTLAEDPSATLKALWKGEYKGEKFLPEWMYLPINETQWFKDTKKYLTDFKDTFQGDPAGTLKALWEGKDPVTGESFLPTWMTDPSVLATNIKVMFKALLPAWMTDDKKDLNLKLKELDKTLGLPTQDEIEKALKDMIKMIYDPETGAVFGINFRNLKNMLPSLQEIADEIISSLPKFMRPNTIAEQIEDIKRDIADRKKWIAEGNLYPGADWAAKGAGTPSFADEIDLLEEKQRALENQFGIKTSSAASYVPSTSQLAWLQKSRAPGDKLMQLKSVTTGDNANGPVVIVNNKDGDKTKVDATVTTIALNVDNSEMSQRFYGQDKFFPVATAV